MNIKSIITWIIVILLSLSLAITTLTNTKQTEQKNIKKIDKFTLTQNEIENILIKLKNKYPSLNKINNINLILEKKIIDHISSNIKFKKLGFICGESELIYLIKKSKIFQNNGKFSEEKYKKYLERQKINEYILQTHVKKLSENTKINKFIKKNKNKIINIQNKKETALKKIKYNLISKKNLIKNTKITQDFKIFEKKYIKNYKIPKIYKIYYKNINKNINKYVLVYRNDINKKLLKLISQNETPISLLSKNGNFLIKKINTIKQKLNIKIYKKDLINKYKLSKIKKIIKNQKNIGKEKIAFISAKCNKNHTLINIDKNANYIIKNKNGYIKLKKKYEKYIKLTNKNVSKKLYCLIKNKKEKLKTKLKNNYL